MKTALLALTLLTSLTFAKPSDKLIHAEKTPSGEIAIFESPEWGRMVTLNGAIQMTEAESPLISEMMAHVPLLAHGKAKSVLILGGADGALLAEVVKHTALEQIVVVEPDSRLLALTKAHLPTAASAFQDKRVQLVEEEAILYLQNCAAHFDVIFSEQGLNAKGYARCKQLLQKRGLVIAKLGFPFLDKHILPSQLEHQKTVFKYTSFYTAPSLSRIGGLLAFSMSGDKKYRPSEKTLKERLTHLNISLLYYTPTLHRASFALPPLLQRQFAAQ